MIGNDGIKTLAVNYLLALNTFRQTNLVNKFSNGFQQHKKANTANLFAINHPI